MSSIGDGAAPQLFEGVGHAHAGRSFRSRGYVWRGISRPAQDHGPGAWGVPLDDETADGIRLVVSELITNAVVHGEGPVTVALFHRPGHLVIEVLDASPLTPQPNCAEADDESGRGLLLVDTLAARAGWESSDRGKRVWADLALPKPALSVRADVLRRFLAVLQATDVRAASKAFVLAVA
ncbi:ATP-binding protein [Streptomyces platensis]|uniref:ATP-binding protein n=1 Tax=Streptomyces platensis TaxID=58346 RepID=UPI0037B90AE7